MGRPVTKLGKVGSTVYGRNHHGQTQYALVIPANPRTAPQQANRSGFGATGPGWGGLTDAERTLWKADARNYRTHGRPGGSATLTGFQRYMSVNAKRAGQGLPPLRVPPSAASLESLPVAPASPAPLPRRQPHCPTARVPMHYRSAAAATPLRHAWASFAVRCAPVYPRAGPSPPCLSCFCPQFSAQRPPAAKGREGFVPRLGSWASKKGATLPLVWPKAGRIDQGRGVNQRQEQLIIWCVF